MAFVDMSVVNLGLAEVKLETFIAEMPMLLITLPKTIGRTMMDTRVMPAIRQNTPVKTGALQEATDYTMESAGPETRFKVFSTAENDRSGYQYARARAYGFKTVAGNDWIPPEDPRYPIAGFEQADVSGIGAMLPTGSIMKIVPL